MALRRLLFVLAILLATANFAQDTLFYTNGDTIIGQVGEVGKETVSYRTNSAGNSVAITVDKLELQRLKLASGQTFVFNDRSGDQRSAGYTERTNLISLDFIAPALDHFTVGYERLLRPHMSLSIKLGYLSLGIASTQNGEAKKPTGALLKAGVNFFLPPSQKRLRSGRTLHPLSGWYLRPEIIVNAWSQDRASFYYEGIRDDYTNLCLNLTIGRKLVIGERFTFDFHGGLGYGLQWVNGLPSKESKEYEEYAYSHAFLGNSPLILTGGLMFGYLF